ncbi:MAG TPA: hypothetical protein VMF07_12135 [Solirubrobacteraceae bacterium]|nr:hypothetical protein [Solirubrobacteraceae bacterium]
MLVSLCLAVALGPAAPWALAASTTRATTTPSLTKSFPLGRHRLHHSASAGSGSSPTGAASQPKTGASSQPKTGADSRPARRAGSGTGHPALAWILILLGAIGLTALVTYFVQRRVMTRRARRAGAISEAPAGSALVEGPPADAPPPDAPPPDAPPPEVPPAGAPSAPEPVKFVLYQDNGGGYYWTIVDESGEMLARSVGFATYPEANYTADLVHRAVASATFENRTGTSPPTEPPPSSDQAAEGESADPSPSPESASSVSREEVTRQARTTREWPAGSSSTPGGRRR